MKNEENLILEIKIYKENLNNYKKNLNDIANLITKQTNNEKLHQIVKDTLKNENLVLLDYTIHIKSLITGLKHKVDILYISLMITKIN